MNGTPKIPELARLQAKQRAKALEAWARALSERHNSRLMSGKIDEDIEAAEAMLAAAIGEDGTPAAVAHRVALVLVNIFRGTSLEDPVAVVPGSEANVDHTTALIAAVAMFARALHEAPTTKPSIIVPGAGQA